MTIALSQIPNERMANVAGLLKVYFRGKAEVRRDANPANTVENETSATSHDVRSKLTIPAKRKSQRGRKNGARSGSSLDVGDDWIKKPVM